MQLRRLVLIFCRNRRNVFLVQPDERRRERKAREAVYDRDAHYERQRNLEAEERRPPDARCFPMAGAASLAVLVWHSFVECVFATTAASTCWPMHHGKKRGGLKHTASLSPLQIRLALEQGTGPETFDPMSAGRGTASAWNRTTAPPPQTRATTSRSGSGGPVTTRVWGRAPRGTAAAAATSAFAAAAPTAMRAAGTGTGVAAASGTGTATAGTPAAAATTSGRAR